jgi:hypothetical protein
LAVRRRPGVNVAERPEQTARRLHLGPHFAPLGLDRVVQPKRKDVSDGLKKRPVGENTRTKKLSCGVSKRRLARARKGIRPSKADKNAQPNASDKIRSQAFPHISNCQKYAQKKKRAQAHTK